MEKALSPTKYPKIYTGLSFGTFSVPGFGPKNVQGSWGCLKISYHYGKMATPILKKCSCSRAPQPLDQFLDKNGKEVATCLKCRTKAKKYDQKPERKEYHNELQREKKYYVEWRARQLEERPEEFREHNNQVNSAWRAENAEHAARWARVNVNPRLDAIKRSAEQRNIEWHLTDEEAKSMLLRPCVYCKHIDLQVRVNGIDRMDSNKNYTIENCRPCCKNCNYMKGTFDPRTFIEWARRIAQCDAEFPDIPRCEEHKKRNVRKQLPPAPQQENQTTQDPCQDLQGTREGHQCAEKTPSLQTSP